MEQRIALHFYRMRLGQPEPRGLPHERVNVTDLQAVRQALQSRHRVRTQILVTHEGNNFLLAQMPVDTNPVFDPEADSSGVPANCVVEPASKIHRSKIGTKVEVADACHVSSGEAVLPVEFAKVKMLAKQ